MIYVLYTLETEGIVAESKLSSIDALNSLKKKTTITDDTQILVTVSVREVEHNTPKLISAKDIEKGKY